VRQRRCAQRANEGYRSQREHDAPHVRRSNATLIAVSRPSRCWMRLARLLVTCLAMVLARPAAAEPGAFDGIVLVAGTRFAAEVPSATEETSSSPSRIPSRRTPAAHDVSPDDLRAAKLHSPRTRIARKYLRHCALLC